MIYNLPDLVIFKIISYLQLPDIFSLVKYDNRLERIISFYSKYFYFCDNEKKINHIFKFNYLFLKKNFQELKINFEYLRNNYFIDYTFQDDTYENFICYLDTRNWFIIEYYLLV